MFYKKNRKIMYLPLIIIALMISFLCGEKYRNITISNKKIMVQNINYNNILKIETIASADSNFLGYEVQLDTTITKKISIYVYPLTKDMLADLNNNALNINTIPFKTSNLDVALLKQQQIKDLLN